MTSSKKSRVQELHWHITSAQNPSSTHLLLLCFLHTVSTWLAERADADVLLLWTAAAQAPVTTGSTGMNGLGGRGQLSHCCVHGKDVTSELPVYNHHTAKGFLNATVGMEAVSLDAGVRCLSAFLLSGQA